MVIGINFVGLRYSLASQACGDPLEDEVKRSESDISDADDSSDATGAVNSIRKFRGIRKEWESMQSFGNPDQIISPELSKILSPHIGRHRTAFRPYSSWNNCPCRTSRRCPSTSSPQCRGSDICCGTLRSPSCTVHHTELPPYS
jgi:hypothetical protein